MVTGFFCSSSRGTALTGARPKYHCLKVAFEGIFQLRSASLGFCCILSDCQGVVPTFRASYTFPDIYEKKSGIRSRIEQFYSLPLQPKGKTLFPKSPSLVSLAICSLFFKICRRFLTLKALFRISKYTAIFAENLLKPLSHSSLATAR